VHVTVLLDAYWYNVEDERDNDEMAALINHIAVAEGIPLEGRCADLESNKLEKIHNKGVIVNNRSVLVSSINWNSNSPNFNREAGSLSNIRTSPGILRRYSKMTGNRSGQKLHRIWTISKSQVWSSSSSVLL